jgi:threonyl-tRNA synthetase
VLAQAVQKVNPDARLGIGPPVTDGFYYDFDVHEAFTPEDLKALQKEMDRIIRQGQRSCAAWSPRKRPAKSSPPSPTSSS